MNGRFHLDKTIEQNIPNNLPLEEIIEHYTKVIGEQKCRKYLIDKLQPQLNEKFTKSTSNFYSKNFTDTFKVLYSSKATDMDIYTVNEIVNQRTKNELSNLVLSKTNISEQKPLIFLEQTLRMPIFTNHGPIFITDAHFLVYHTHDLFQQSEHVTLYSDKQNFLRDTKHLIQGLNYKNTNGFFNLGLITTNDSEKTLPPENLDFTKVA
jgi:hypothetical protein